MTQKRIYVGNLATEISADDLREKFSRFGSIEDLEVKTKNDSHFAFISIKFDTEDRSKEAIEVMNGTKWRGSWIKVQVAKENFLDKLKREQQSAHGPSQPNGQPMFPFRPAGRGRPAQDKPPTAIISFEDEEQTEGTVVTLKKPTSSPVKLSKKKASNSDSDSGSDDEEKSGVMPFKGIFAYPELQDKDPKKDGTLLVPKVASTADIPILPSDGQDWRSRRGQQKQAATEVPAPPKAPTDEVQSKLLSLAGMANGEGAPAHRYNDRRQQAGQIERSNRNNVTWHQNQQNENQEHPYQRERGEKPVRNDTWNQQSQVQSQRSASHVKFDTPIESAPTETAVPSSEPEPVKTGVLNFKKRNSDALRQKSLENRTFALQNQKDIIRSSLASVKIAPPAISTKPANSGKKQKMFGENEDDTVEDYGNAFNIKPQFEGKTGAKNLEYSSKMASYDSRFKMDERFRDYDEEKRQKAQEAYDEGYGAEADLRKEKEAHLSILSGILGEDTATIKPPKPVQKKKKQAVPAQVIVGRYDPDADEERESEPITEKPPQAKKAKKSGPEEVSHEPGPVGESIPAGEADEKASYFVASNLKDLFSSPATGGFSLLKSFGTGESAPVAEKNGICTSLPKNKSKAKTRNPFKYDSSDSEDETPEKTPNSIVVKAPAAKFKLGKREGFFYVDKDKRLDGVEEYFFKSDEKIQDVVDRFNSGERSELRIICRGKVKNTKRKSEKRMLTLKRMKRKIRDKKKFDEKKLEGSNAVPLGNKQAVKVKRDFKSRR